MSNYLDKFSLKGKNVFVAGGAGLLGAQISKTIANVGGKTIILDISREKGQAVQQEIEKEGGQTVYEYFDIGDLENMEANIDALLEKYKRIDVWINATYPRTDDWPKRLEDMDLNYLRGNVDKHLNSCIWASRKVAMAMKESKTKGVIINFGSIYGLQANDLNVYKGTPMFGEITYCTMKAGIINLTKYLASHFGPYGIRANSLCPGGIFDNQNETFVKNYERKVPLKRLGSPEDVSSAALFLASDVSSYITGATLTVDGGWTIV